MTQRPPPAAGSGGTPNPVTLERLEVLREQWAAGTPTSELARFCRDRWKLKDRAARELVARLRQQIRDEMDTTTRADFVAELVDRYREQYRAAHVAGNHAAAVGALSGMARCLGIPDMPAIEARAMREVCLQVLEVIAQSGLTADQKLNLHLQLTARGLAPMPALEAQPLEVLARLADGDAHEG